MILIEIDQYVKRLHCKFTESRRPPHIGCGEMILWTRHSVGPGHRLEFYALEDGRLGIRVRRSKPSSAYGILTTFGEGLDEAALRDAVGEAVAERFGARPAKGSGKRGE